MEQEPSPCRGTLVGELLKILGDNINSPNDRRVSGASRGAIRGAKATDRGINALAELFAPYMRALQRDLEVLAPILIQIYQEFDRWTVSSEVIGKAGWLPHCTMPFEEVTQCRDDIEKVRELLLNYYLNNWKEVRSEIESRVSKYRIDDEAKETMSEALKAHEAGLYRSVCRLVYPEIERIFRVETFNNKVGHVTPGKILEELLLDSQAGLECYTPRGLYDLTILRHLTKNKAQESRVASDAYIAGLFERVDSEEDRLRLEQSEIPNRHAAIHGLVVYSSRQNSLNAIFTFDYICTIFSNSKP